MSATEGWRATLVFFPRRDILTGKKIWGGVMARTMNGEKQYRAMTDQEDHDEWIAAQW